MRKLDDSGLRPSQVKPQSILSLAGLCLRTPLLNLATALAILLVAASLSAANSIRDVDFKNFAYPLDRTGSPLTYWRWITRIAPTKVKLSNGTHSFQTDSPYQIPMLRMTSVTYGKLAGENGEVAAVALNYTGGGTANWDYLYIYKLDKGAPLLLALMESGSRAYGGLVKVQIESGLLVLDFADGKRSVGDCCSEGYVRVRYAWKNGQFTESGPREKGDLELDIKPTQ